MVQVVQVVQEGKVFSLDDMHQKMIKIQGGHEVDGTPLYVAVGKINGVDAIGKVSIL